jgi:hypothetical protein
LNLLTSKITPPNTGLLLCWLTWANLSIGDLFSCYPADVQPSTFYFILGISYEPGCGCRLTFFKSQHSSKPYRYMALGMGPQSCQLSSSFQLQTLLLDVIRQRFFSWRLTSDWASASRLPTD